jgi:hypothetical protein
MPLCNGSGFPSNPKEYPVFVAFGRYHRFLSAEEARNATPEERIQSVWPAITRQVNQFVASLHQRELACFDPDDILLECWIELRQKDAKWVPEKGAYLSFSCKLVHHLFVRIRERARTVESPRNASCKLAESRTDEISGRLSRTRTKGMHDIDRTISGTIHIGIDIPDEPDERDPPSFWINKEESAVSSEGIRQVIEQLGPRKAMVLGRLFGLWGQPQCSVSELATELGKTTEQIRKLRNSAYRMARSYLESEFHPAAQDYA